MECFHRWYLSPVSWALFTLCIDLQLGVELLQPIVGRSFDVDDVLLNLAGILAGYFIGLLWEAYQKRRQKREQTPKNKGNRL